MRVNVSLTQSQAVSCEICICRLMEVLFVDVCTES